MWSHSSWILKFCILTLISIAGCTCYRKTYHSCYWLSGVNYLCAWLKAAFIFWLLLPSISTWLNANYLFQNCSKQIQWVQCEDCSKWRKIPADALLPSKWTCSENLWDPKRYVIQNYAFYFDSLFVWAPTAHVAVSLAQLHAF